MAEAVKSKRDFVRSVELFEKLPAQAVDRLVMVFEHHQFPDRCVIFRQGDTGDRVYLVESGKVELLRSDEIGKVFTLAEIEHGGYFGEVALLSDRPRAATARCMGETGLLSISGRQLKRLLAESGPALRSIIGTVSEYRPPEKPPSLWQRLSARKSDLDLEDQKDSSA